MTSLQFLLRGLGQVIRRLRDQADYSQERFASAIGVHRTYMGLIERGTANPTTKVLYSIAETLGLTLPELFTMALNEDTAGTPSFDIAVTHRNPRRRGAVTRPSAVPTGSRRRPGKREK